MSQLIELNSPPPSNIDVKVHEIFTTVLSLIIKKTISSEKGIKINVKNFKNK